MSHSTVDKLRPVLAVALVLSGLLVAQTADAFCGFYVSQAGESLHNDATAVSLMRKDQATVLSMENTYIGPPKDFAMVVPVPEVLEKDQVKTLDKGVFDRIKKQTAPRLVEYFEQDPCPQPVRRRRSVSGLGGMARSAAPKEQASADSARQQVKVHAKFSVGEYDIVILSSEESNALETWLKQENYSIPSGSAKYFRPYVQQGSYFFVAKVNTDKLNFSGEQAQLSPLRFHYESKDFKLPIRLGLINSKGMQDLLTFIIAKGQRYEVANRKNVLAPTNFVVDKAVKSNFGAFYNDLFDRVREKNEDAVVTEYSWRAGKCDPCPVRPMTRADFQTLGGDVIHTIGSETEGPDLEPESMTISSEKVNADKFAQQLRRYRTQAQYCARRYARSKGIEHGNVSIQFDVGPSGRVHALSIEDDDFGGAGNCIGSQIFRYNFQQAMTSSSRGMFTVKKTYKFENIQSRRRARGPYGWTITRMHYRYGKSGGGRDLVFKKAKPIYGGRGTPTGMPEDGVKFHSPRRVTQNQYQARYMVLHKWSGDLDCKNPRRGRWGGRGGGRRRVHAGNTRPTSSTLNGSLEDLVVDGDLP